MSEIDLKPCPFCGCADPAKVRLVDAWFGTRSHTVRGRFHRVVCDNCGCVGRTTDDDGFFYLSDDAAREAWNRRAT